MAEEIWESDPCMGTAASKRGPTHGFVRAGEGRSTCHLPSCSFSLDLKRKRRIKQKRKYGGEENGARVSLMLFSSKFLFCSTPSSFSNLECKKNSRDGEAAVCHKVRMSGHARDTVFGVLPLSHTRRP